MWNIKIYHMLKQVLFKMVGQIKRFNMKRRSLFRHHMLKFVESCDYMTGLLWDNLGVQGDRDPFPHITKRFNWK